jgi:hypothetical protein
MILHNLIKYQHSLTYDIKNYLLKMFTKFSEEEKNHFNELYIQYPENNTFERILSIIIRVEENRIQLANKLTQNTHYAQEIGKFTKGFIDLSPPDIQEIYINFVKEERILNLNSKLCKTFEKFDKEIIKFIK